MDIKDAFMNAVSALWTKVAAFVPNLAAGVFILVLGYILSRLLASVTRTLIAKLGIDKAGENAGVQKMLKASGVVIEPSEIIARTVFLFSMLVFVITAADSLGLDTISATFDSFILFLPKVVAAIVIALLGLFFAQLLRDAVRRTTEGLGVEYAAAIATAAHGLTVVVIVTLAVNQLDIDTGILHLVIGIGLAVAGLAAAIALGLGTQRVAQNIVSGVYARDMLEPGLGIRWNETDGEIMEVGPVTTIIEIADGRRLHVPNSQLMGEVFVTKSG
jgi:small-conductance mechanosensitive channel